MVNFNSDMVVGIAPINLVKIGIIESRENLLLAIEKYYELAENGQEPNINYILSRLRTLTLKLQPLLTRQLKDYEYLLIEDSIFRDSSLNLDNVLEIFFQLNIIMDKVNLIKIDTKEHHDDRIIEYSNKRKHL